MDRVQNSAAEDPTIEEEDSVQNQDERTADSDQTGSGHNNVNNLFQKSSTQPNYNNVNGSHGGGQHQQQQPNANYRKNYSKDKASRQGGAGGDESNRIETGYEFKFPHEKYSKAANWRATGEHPDDGSWHRRSHERVRRATRPKEENKNTCSLYIQTDPLIWRHIRDSIADVSILIILLFKFYVQ